MDKGKGPVLSDRVHQLRIFVQVAELSSFVKAASALKLPPATVSSAVRLLEADIGVRLLHRTTRQVRLTAEGEMLLPMARRIAHDLDEIYSALQTDLDSVSGRFALDVPSRIATRLIVPALPAFLLRHPSLELHVSGNDRHVDLATEGIDCVIRVGEPRDEGLLRKPLGTLDMVNCASPAYLAQHPPLRHPDDLVHHHAVGYSTFEGAQASGTKWNCASASGAVRSVTLRHRIVVNNVESYLAACSAGVGLIQVPRFDVQHLLDSGELVEVLRDWPPPPMPVSALYLYRHQRSHRLAVVLDWLQEVLAHILVVPTRGPGAQRSVT